MDGDIINSKGFNPAAATPDMAAKCTGCTFCAIICPDNASEVDR
jgi:NAD-dependent dihydropyrimidine dehydrogenase PreA subunit